MSPPQAWLLETEAPLFRTFVLDPPWLEAGGGGRGAQNHYPLLKAEEMPATIRKSGLFRPYPNAHMYLWVTNNFLEDGLWLMRQLGFRYVTNLPWNKPGKGIGQYFRGEHELLLFGVHGDGMSPDVMTDRRDLGTRIDADWVRAGEGGPRIHSAKPPEAYERIQARSNGPYLEMFARGKPRGPQWQVWGNEAQPKEELNTTSPQEHIR
jgi:N6-adenosine-specific RNA methylase IME4